MRRALCVAVVLSLSGAARADDKDALAVVEKAVKAAGGEAKLKEIKAATWKEKGKFHRGGVTADLEATYNLQMPGRYRAETVIDAGGQKFELTRVVDGDKAYNKTNDQVREIEKEMLGTFKADLYRTAMMLNPMMLKDKDVKLTPLGESKVGDRAAVGVKAAPKDVPEISLFFDKEKGHLLKYETKTRTQQGQEATLVVELSGHKEMDGVTIPTKRTVKRDGELQAEAEVTEFKLKDKLDDKTFARP